MRRSMTFRLDEGLIARVDAAVEAGSARNRTAFLEEALEAFLGSGPAVAPGGRAVEVRAAVAESRVERAAKRERLELARAVMRAASSSEAKLGVVPVGWQARTDA